MHSKESFAHSSEWLSHHLMFNCTLCAVYCIVLPLICASATSPIQCKKNEPTKSAGSFYTSSGGDKGRDALNGQSCELSVAQANEADAFGNAEVGFVGRVLGRFRNSVSVLCFQHFVHIVARNPCKQVARFSWSTRRGLCNKVAHTIILCRFLLSNKKPHCLVRFWWR